MINLLMVGRQGISNRIKINEAVTHTHKMRMLSQSQVVKSMFPVEKITGFNVGNSAKKLRTKNGLLDSTT